MDDIGMDISICEREEEDSLSNSNGSVGTDSQATLDQYHWRIATPAEKAEDNQHGFQQIRDNSE
jgi:hypothetical protein